MESVLSRNFNGLLKELKVSSPIEYVALAPLVEPSPEEL